MGPLLTLKTHEALQSSSRSGCGFAECSLDLERSRERVPLGADYWEWQGRRYPFLSACKDRTVYFWSGESFQPVMRFTQSLIKLVPTEWGPPTFEIDGIKMLPTLRVSPYEDAERKVRLIRPANKTILDTCGGLGYFASWCRQLGAARIQSFEKNPDVIWLRGHNPWSPPDGEGLTVLQADVAREVLRLPAAGFDAVLHDPPRFGIAGELYSQAFYDQLARVLKPGGLLFHYVGSPNRLTSGRDVLNEVGQRLRKAGFKPRIEGDGLLAVLRRS